MTAYYSFFTLYLKDELHMQNAAWVWALGSASEIPMLFFGGWIIRRVGLAAMLTASMAAVTVRRGIYAAMPALWAVLPAQLLHSMTFGLFHAASIEFTRRRVSPARRGAAMAVYTSLALGVPNWIASSLGGELIQRCGYATMLLMYAAVPLAGIACLATKWRKVNTASAG